AVYAVDDVNVPEADSDQPDLSSEQLGALAVLDGAVQGATVLAPVCAEDDENGNAALLRGGERPLNGCLGVGRFIVWKRRGYRECGEQSAQEEEGFSHDRLL